MKIVRLEKTDIHFLWLCLEKTKTVSRTTEEREREYGVRFTQNTTDMNDRANICHCQGHVLFSTSFHPDEMFTYLKKNTTHGTRDDLFQTSALHTWVSHVCVNMCPWPKCVQYTLSSILGNRILCLIA